MDKIIFKSSCVYNPIKEGMIAKPPYHP